MEALHPDAFKPQLPAGYESAAAVFHRWVLYQLNRGSEENGTYSPASITTAVQLEFV
jgi:hypothetical protein